MEKMLSLEHLSDSPLAKEESEVCSLWSCPNQIGMVSNMF